MKLVYALIAILFLTACDTNRVFEENKEIEKNNWDNSEKLQFEVAIEDTSSPYNIYLNVRNAGWYPFSNLFLFVTTRSPDGVVWRDTAECTLADNDGRWLGDGMGDIWDNKILFMEKFKFTQTGMYSFELEQAMRVNPLPGIMDAGIRVEKVKQ